MTNTRGVSNMFGVGIGRRAFRWGVTTLCTLVMAAAPGTAVFAQGTETYTFPGTEADTEYTIGNFNNQTVAVTASFYDGSTGESVQHVEVLAPGTQARFTAESVGVDSFDGTTVVSADLPVAVTASRIEGPNSFEHMSPTDSSVELVIPLGAYGGSQVEIVLYNPGTETAAARVILVAENGTAVTFSDRSVQPNRTDSISFTVDQNSRYAVVRTSNFFLGGRPVSAGAIVKNFLPPGGGPKSDVAWAPGRAALSEVSSTRIPLFRQGGGFSSTVQVINNSTAPQEITLTALGQDGQPVSGGNNPATLEVAGTDSVPGRGVFTDTVEDLFAISDVALQSGSILVEGSARLSAAVSISPSSDSAHSILGADPNLVQHFAFQTREVGREFDYLVNLLNPSSGAANVDMIFVRDDGTVVSSISTSIPGQTQVVSSLADLFPEALGAGAVVVHSNVALVAGGLERARDNKTSAQLRALPAAADFMSGTPTELFAVGTVRSNGLGLAGVTVTLTGAASGTTLTDAAGTYIFNDLVAGSYSLSAQAIGYTLSPPARNFTISTDSSRDNDFVASLVVPVITRVTPSAAPAGSAAVEIAIEGGPFIASSVAVLGTTTLSTTVVNSQLVLATVPTSLLQAPSQRPLVVRNVGLDGDSVDSAAVTFTVGTPPPTLISLTGQPQPLIAGASGFDLTLLGAGFIPGVTVSVNGVFRSATFVSDTELRVAITTAELAAGGFLPVRALNPGPAVPSNPLDLVVLNPPPTLTAISPETGQVSLSSTLPPLAISVTGSGFQDGATVLVDSTSVPTTFVSATALTALVPSSLLTTAGVHDVQVSNPEPAAGPSFALPLTLSNPVPVLTGVSGTVAYDPGQAGAEQLAPILLQGASFVAGSTVWVNPPCDALGFRLLPNTALDPVPTQYVTRRLSPNTLTATVNVQCAGNYEFQVRSPQPGGGSSATSILVVP